MSTNTLVAGPVQTSSALSGTMLLESLGDLTKALQGDDWLAVGLGGASVAMDAVSTVVDPLGSLIGAGLGWLMEHLEPLKGWLNDLTGDAGAVGGFAATWDNIAAQMDTASGDLDHLVRADLAAMSGDAVLAYAKYADDMGKQIRGLSASSASVATSLRTCATVVQVVHDVVRDALAGLVGAIIAWTAELVLTVGLSTPVVVAQVTTRVSELASRVGKSVSDVIASAKSLKNLIEALKDAMARLAANLRGAHAPRAAEVPALSRSVLADISDLDHLKSTDLDAWAHAVADRHPTLTADEVLAVHSYTTNAGYKAMNGASRLPGKYSPEELTRIQGEMDDVSAGLRRMPAYDGTTFRGTNLPDAVLKSWVPGNTVHDAAFTSSSLDPNVAESFRVGNGGNAMIQVQGRSGVDVQPLSHFGTEAEILFDRGVEFNVISRTWNDRGFWDFLIKEAMP